jgi:hypothetical protein
LFGAAISEPAGIILRHFDQNLRSAKEIGDFLQDYHDAVMHLGSPDQGDIFGDEPPEKTDILRNTHERRTRKPENGDLFKSISRHSESAGAAYRPKPQRESRFAGGDQARKSARKGPLILFRVA